jgi:hypothetical protein
LFRNQEQLAGLGYFRTIDGTTHWRLTVRVPAMSDTDYGELLEELRRVVSHTPLAIEPSQLLITGGVPLIYQVQQQLLHDLIESFLLAFALVCVSLMLVFRSVLCGFVCMIPNLLPCAIVFGFFGWMGIRIEVGTVLTACAALGIAVDDSLHFITWFQRRVSQSESRMEAVVYAYRRCGLAMLQTTLVITLGLLVFALSSFAPMQRFAWCMFALLATALIADLVVLPAILLSFLGRLFLPRRTRPPASLSELAWRVVGPRDALINVAINVPIALLVYWGVERLPLAGHPSLLTMCGPMSFILPTVTTYFGYMNGVIARRSGRIPPAWQPNTRWKLPATIWGLGSGIVSCATCTVSLLVLASAWPDFVLTKWQAVGSIGLLAAAMGYLFHSVAVARTRKLGAREYFVETVPVPQSVERAVPSDSLKADKS